MLDFYQAVAGLLPVLVLAGIVEFNVRARRIDEQPTWLIWASLSSYLVFFASAITAEVLALHVLKRGSASEAAEDLIEIALIASVGVLIWDSLTSYIAALEERTQFPIWVVLTALIATCQVAGSLAAVWT